MGPEPDIAVSNIHKRFGETVALNGCTFGARKGEVHAIVGENGSGKSTLAKILSGVISPDSGSVSIFGAMPASPIEARRLGIATIFQEILVAESATVMDNLFVGTGSIWRRSLSRRAARDLAADMMARFTGTRIDPDCLAGSLPLSVKQWIVIGRAFLVKPRVLILDESSAALDLDATARLHQEIRSLRDAGCVIILVTHRIAELIKITDRATVLRDGQNIGELGKADITEQNLLSLMTPAKWAITAPQVRRANESDRNACAILSVAGLKLAREAVSIDFSIARGEVVGVTGLDGQGQDRFLHALAGLASAEAGMPVIHDDDGKEIPLRGLPEAETAGVAYVSGDRKREGIFPNLSIYENLGIGLFRSHLGPLGWIRQAEIAAAYDAEVSRLSIKIGKRSRKITSLSGGNQQKVLIGRALARRPRLLILNDPVRGVDLGTKRELYDELRRFAGNGGAVIYLSSEIEEFLGFADRVAVFRAGSVFRMLIGDDISEHAMLAAMFGHVGEVDFDLGRQSVAK